MNYHNVTPPELYAAWDNAMARHQLLAQTQLRRLATRCSLGLAVSAFNEAELREAGYGRTAVVPPAAIVPIGAGTANAAPPGACLPLAQRRPPRPQQGHRARRDGTPRRPGPTTTPRRP